MRKQAISRESESYFSRKSLPEMENLPPRDNSPNFHLEGQFCLKRYLGFGRDFRWWTFLGGGLKLWKFEDQTQIRNSTQIRSAEPMAHKLKTKTQQNPKLLPRNNTKETTNIEDKRASLDRGLYMGKMGSICHFPVLCLLAYGDTALKF